MPNTITLSELRKRLRQVGAKVKTESLSFVVAGSIYNSEGEELPSIFMGKHHLNKWIPVLEIINDVDVVVNNHSEKISGPWS